MEKERLSKTLANAGVASRRGAETLIFDGRVSVNGEIVLVPQTKVNPHEDKIRVDDKAISVSSNAIYILLNKPKGYVCSCSKEFHPKIILDLFPDINARIFPVGRLDKATTGLILLTNDGQFANKVIHPRSNIEKEYLASTDVFLTDTHLKRISEGITIEGKKILPVKVQKVRKNKLKITVKEGKKHEVRLLIKAAGMKTQSLKRIRIGGLSLGSLEEGQYKKVSRSFLEAIFQ
ncbi:MAG: pseudouridine synthase [Chlamydiales bacterium]|nr:rRNA pseudouridine synthase [Chlamydiales bacterium]NCF71745.1 pseudouridine synthase [Chlamydiales bacterium]